MTAPVVVASTGLPFALDRGLTPEREALVLASIDQAGRGVPTSRLSDLLGMNVMDTSRLLQEMAERGLIRREMAHNRGVWDRQRLDVDASLLRDEWRGRIRDFLVGKRETARGIAQALNLPLAHVDATCKTMMREGQLAGTPIGMSWIFALEVRGSVRQGTPRATTHIPMSPLARFRAELAQLPPEEPIKIRRPSALEDKERRARNVEANRLMRTRRAQEARAEQEAELVPLFVQGWRWCSEVAAERKVRTASVTDWVARHPDHKATCRLIGTARRLLMSPTAIAAHREASLKQEGLKAVERKPVARQRSARQILRDQRRQEFLDRRAAEKAARPERKSRRVRPPEASTGQAEQAQDLTVEMPAHGERYLGEMAKALDVGYNTLSLWLRRRPELHAQCREVRRRLFVPVAVEDAYRAWRDAGGREARSNPVVPDGHQTLRSAALALGVTVQAIAKWLTRQPELREQCHMSSGQLIVPDAVVERYRDGQPDTVALTEDGAMLLDIWQAVRLTQYSHHMLYKLSNDGRLPSTLIGNQSYFALPDLLALKARLDDESNPPPDWISIHTLTAEEGVTKQAVNVWFRRNGFAMGNYRDPERRLAFYLCPEGVAAYRAARATQPGGLKFVPQAEAEARALYAALLRRGGPGVTVTVAARFGVCEGTVRALLRRAPSPESLACVVDPLVLLPPVPPMLPAPVPTTRPVARVTLALEEQLRAELTPQRRRIPGETARVAEKYGLSLKQVRNALSRIPTPKES